MTEHEALPLPHHPKEHDVRYCRSCGEAIDLVTKPDTVVGAGDECWVPELDEQDGFEFPWVCPGDATGEHFPAPRVDRLSGRRLTLVPDHSTKVNLP